MSFRAGRARTYGHLSFRIDRDGYNPFLYHRCSWVPARRFAATGMTGGGSPTPARRKPPAAKKAINTAGPAACVPVNVRRERDQERRQEGCDFAGEGEQAEIAARFAPAARGERAGCGDEACSGPGHCADGEAEREENLFRARCHRGGRRVAAGRWGPRTGRDRARARGCRGRPGRGRPGAPKMTGRAPSRSSSEAADERAERACHRQQDAEHPKLQRAPAEHARAVDPPEGE